MQITLSFQELSIGAKLLAPTVVTLKKRVEKFISTSKFQNLITRNKKVADPLSKLPDLPSLVLVDRWYKRRWNITPELYEIRLF